MSSGIHGLAVRTIANTARRRGSVRVGQASTTAAKSGSADAILSLTSPEKSGLQLTFFLTFLPSVFITTCGFNGL